VYLCARNAQRTYCPICGEARFVVDPITGASRSRRVVYHFTIAPFLRSIFSRPEVAKEMGPEHGSRAAGDLRFSRVWKQKLTDNAHMSGDCRNVALTMFSDGVPWSGDGV
jgi:hypothetical protein